MTITLRLWTLLDWIRSSRKRNIHHKSYTSFSVCASGFYYRAGVQGNNVADYGKTAAKNKTKIEFNSERMVLFAKINPGLISQAVSNLIENSIKYCPEHSIISLDVEEIQSDSGKKSVRIIEQDNGPGIPPQYRIPHAVDLIR